MVAEEFVDYYEGEGEENAEQVVIYEVHFLFGI